MLQQPWQDQQHHRSLDNRNSHVNDSLEGGNSEEIDKKGSNIVDSTEVDYTTDKEIQNNDLNKYAAKKLLGTFDENDKNSIQRKLTKGNSIEERITNKIVKLL